MLTVVPGADHPHLSLPEQESSQRTQVGSAWRMLHRQPLSGLGNLALRAQL